MIIIKNSNRLAAIKMAIRLKKLSSDTGLDMGYKITGTTIYLSWYQELIPSDIPYALAVWTDSMVWL